jgi:hypothetical protein
MQGMIDLVQKGFFPKGSKVLYAHLGGAPALNGYSYTFSQWLKCREVWRHASPFVVYALVASLV